jgi:hypothetical protein
MRTAKHLAAICVTAASLVVYSCLVAAGTQNQPRRWS